MNPVAYKRWLDAQLLDWALQNADRIGRASPYRWLLDAACPEKPGAYLVPLHRMRELPAPFTISPEDRHGRAHRKD